MGSLSRKMKRRQARSEQWRRRKLMRRVDAKLKAMPKTCMGCDAQFDNTDKESLDQWRVAVYDDDRVELTCPDCAPTPDDSAKSGAV